MTSVSGNEFFGGTVPPPPAPVAPVAAPSLASQAWSNITGAVGTDLNTRIDKTSAILARPTNPLEKGLQVFGQGAGLAANTVETVAKQIPGVKQVADAAGKGIDAISKTPPIAALGNLIGGNKTVQNIVSTYDTNQNFKDTVDAVANTFRLGGDIATALDGVNAGVSLGSKASTAIKDAIPKDTPLAAKVDVPKIEGNSFASNIANDVVPKVDAVVNHQVDRALNLTQGDVRDIHLSTGNEPGQFLAKNNLIGDNLEHTTQKVNDFYKTNYTQVRDEIGKVTKVFDKNEVPAYKESLIEIKKNIDNTPGLHEANAEVDDLLKKDKLSLNDVQKVKELMDEHFSLYKAVGDVKEGVAKKGLANLRDELKTFVERKVKDSTGADIKTLNNNVATARSIQDAIEERSTRGLTRSNISLGDMGTFFATSGAFGGNPLVGIAAVLVKKGIESPTFKLRLAKFLDGMSDSQRANLTSKLEKGQVPQELEDLIDSPKSSSDSAASKGSSTIQSNSLPKNDIPTTVPSTGTKIKAALKTAAVKGQRGFVANPFKDGLPKAVKQLNNQDKNLMTRYIDSVRTKGTTLTSSEESDLVKLNETLGINPDQSAETIAKQYEQVIPKVKEQGRKPNGKFDKNK